MKRNAEQNKIKQVKCEWNVYTQIVTLIFFHLIFLQHGRMQSFHGNTQNIFVIFGRFGYSVDVKIQTLCMTSTIFI